MLPLSLWHRAQSLAPCRCFLSVCRLAGAHVLPKQRRAPSQDTLSESSLPPAPCVSEQVPLPLPALSPEPSPQGHPCFFCTFFTEQGSEPQAGLVTHRWTLRSFLQVLLKSSLTNPKPLYLLSLVQSSILPLCS